MIDTYCVICNNCEQKYTTINIGPMDCPNCGKRWIIEIRKRKVPNPRNKKKVLEETNLYLNGCKEDVTNHSFF